MKLRKSLATYQFIEQAERDRRAEEYPVVLMRGDRKPWLVCFPIEYSLRFAQDVLRNWSRTHDDEAQENTV